MKTIELQVQERKETGTKASNRIRRSGRVPVNMYGGKNQMLLSAAEYDCDKILSIPDAVIINLKLNGNTFSSAIQEVQYHPTTDRINHIDLIELEKERKITMRIPVRTVGVAEGTKDGGQVIIRIRRLKVKGLLSDMPDHIDLNVETMKIGHSIKVSDVKVPGLQLLDPPNGTIIRVQPPRAEITVETTAATAAAAAVPGAAVPGAEVKEGAPGEKPAAGKEEGKDKTGKGAAPSAAKEEKKEEKGKK